MKRIGIALIVLSSSINCFGADFKKYTDYGKSIYRIYMEDRFDLATINEPGFNLVINNIEDYRCPLKLKNCQNYGVAIFGQLNKKKFTLKYNENENNQNNNKINSVVVSGIKLRFSHMVGGIEGEPYVFDIEKLD